MDATEFISEVEIAFAAIKAIIESRYVIGVNTALAVVAEIEAQTQYIRELVAEFETPAQG